MTPVMRQFTTLFTNYEPPNRLTFDDNATIIMGNELLWSRCNRSLYLFHLISALSRPSQLSLSRAQ
jgi:hypothetical protein